jgi:hypothetical protein
MNLRIEPFTTLHLDGIRELNRRFDAANVQKGFRLPESWHNPSQEAFGPPPRLPFEQRQYLVLDGERVVGGFMLQEQRFQLLGRLEWITNIQAPISLGVVDRQYAMLGGWMIKTILASKPLLFALGMGGMEMPFPRLLKALRWHIDPVPFQFRVLRPARFLKEIRMLRRSPARYWAARAAAITGAGWAGIRIAQWASGLRARAGKRAGKSTPPVVAEVTAELVSGWGAWTDEVWEEYKQECSMAGLRDCATMQLFQPFDTPRFQVYRFKAPDGRLVGWASIQSRQMENSPHFGDLMVKTILDSVCLPGWEDNVAQGATKACMTDGADLIVSNQQRRLWVGALSKCGFLSGPSNYLLALSPALTRALEPLPEQLGRAHISRADADGRWQL